MDSWEDATAWISAAKGGDRQAFDRLMTRYADSIEGYLRLRLGKELRRRVEIEDLAQETFLRAFRSIGQFRGDTETTFRAWLNTIAEHAVQDQGRRLRARGGGAHEEVSLDQKLRGKEEEGLDLASLLSASGGSPSQAFRRDERFERLKSVLGTLSPDHAKVIQLARVQGLPIKEVAQKMDRSPEATSMLLLRALLKLKAAFGNTESLSLPDRSLEEERGESGR